MNSFRRVRIIFCTVFGLLALYVLVVYYNHQADLQKRRALNSNGNGYTKLECKFLDVSEDDFTYNLTVGAEFLGLLVDSSQWNANDKKAVIDAGNYVRQHQNLQNHGVYEVYLYKHYYSDNDRDGWWVLLRYSRRDDDFSAALVRF